MRSDELLTLAAAYGAALSISHTTVGLLSCGNDKVFRRLAVGKGCNSATIERAAAWFAANWPEDLPWPDSVPRPAGVTSC